MRSVLLGYALGVLVLSYAPRPLSLLEWMLCILLAVAAIAGWSACRRAVPRSCALFVAGALCGALWLDGSVRGVVASILPGEWESRDIWVEGYVASLPRVSTRIGDANTSSLQRFDFALYSAHPVAERERALAMRRIQLSWYDSKQTVIPGARYRLRVRLKRPHGFSNPGGFDYAAHLLAHGIHARGYVRRDSGNTLLPGVDLRALHHRVRASLRTRFNRLQVARRPDLLLALGIGDRSSLDPDTRTVLQDSGTAHLLAISGMHIGFVAFMLYRLGSALVRLSARALVFAPASCWASVVAMLGALVYAALAGFSLATQRALMMLTIVLLSILWRRTLSFSLAFCIALAVILGTQPLAGHTAGFWLSFTAVAALLVFFRRSPTDVASGLLPTDDESRAGMWRYLSAFLSGSKRLLAAQYAVGVALLVPLGIFFHSIPVLSFACNLVAIPLVSFAVVPLGLFAFVLLGVLPDVSALAFGLAGHLLDYLVIGLSKLLYLSSAWNVWHPPAWHWLAVVCAVSGSALALLLRRWPHRALALLLLVPLAWSPSATPDRLQVEMLDVGQGLAVLIRTAKHALLYDSGPKYGSSDAGSLVVLPALRYRGVRALDVLLLSHRDTDHIGGAHSVMAHIPVKEVRISAAHPDADQLKAGIFRDAARCHRGQQWRWDGVHFEILHPPSDYDVATENNRSCVLLVRSAQRSVLLTGDIDKRVELELLSYLRALAPIDVLFAGHHGSNTSSATDWVQALSPRHVFYSTGYRNRFRHPHRSVVRRFMRVQARAHNTASSGAVLLRVNSRGEMNVSGWRERRRRIWSQ